MKSAAEFRRAAATQPGGRSSKAASWLRLIALAEAVTWVGLLTGMYFKYLGTPRTEIGVKIFGMAHGIVFIAFVIAAVLVGIAFAWTARVWVLALLASIVPLASVIFIIWVEKTGRSGAPDRGAAAAPSGTRST